MQVRTIRSLIYLAAGIGLIVSMYAAIEFYAASARSLCDVSSFLSCSAVDNSQYTSTFHVPDYLWGLGGFMVILFVAGVSEQRPADRRWNYVLLFFTTFGIAFSVYFLYVQLALIGALCVVCTTADLFGWIAWFGAIALARAPPPEPIPDRARRASRARADE